ncbi:Hachiman antiphage defense system protein HamA [Treponema brennaborense]|uniref:Anti-bacteriophage protein A/HamA C-terminal domain-containing protein n=1 Tax=Treponema brennaborense (strain DSM 12168 / CIP 105900 / DD5/3) TaxID=906968 RepID=F4LMV7_TREBD|nr:Hachiman antiphage defense system protein HamA [Treponema brennaborense]AEE17847.1 hypothetical protein Trebr_2440 [Treponema brennaborense DSM 12168]
MNYFNWLKKETSLLSVDGKTIEIYSLNCDLNNDAIMSEWATHFRNQYCDDAEIDLLKPKNQSRKDYLNQIKFPDPSNAPGPSIRSGDFGEILISDFLEFLENYWIPRTRYNRKDIQNESSKGSDVLGFKFASTNSFSADDELCIFEVKAGYSETKGNYDRLQDAVNGSQKDEKRKAESLNAIKQRFIDLKQFNEANKIERFQDPADIPYIQEYGAAALFDENIFLPTRIISVDCTEHSNNDILRLIVISVKEMKTLINSLYKRAADEA